MKKTKALLLGLTPHNATKQYYSHYHPAVCEMIEQRNAKCNLQTLIMMQEFFEDFRPAMGRPELWTMTIGLLLGQILIEEFNGKWTLETNPGNNGKTYKELAVSIPGIGTCWPITKARKYVQNGLEDAPTALYMMVAGHPIYHDIKEPGHTVRYFPIPR